MFHKLMATSIQLPVDVCACVEYPFMSYLGKWDSYFSSNP